MDCGRSESHAAHQGTVRLGEEEGSERGSNFVTSFYQNMLENEQKTERECKNDSVDAKEVPLRSNNSVSDGPNPERLSGRGSERVPVTKPETTCNESDIIIHVFDEQRKCKSNPQIPLKFNQLLHVHCSQERVLLPKSSAGERNEVLCRVPLLRRPSFG